MLPLLVIITIITLSDSHLLIVGRVVVQHRLEYGGWPASQPKYYNNNKIIKKKYTKNVYENKEEYNLAVATNVYQASNARMSSACGWSGGIVLGGWEETEQEGRTLHGEWDE